MEYIDFFVAMIRRRLEHRREIQFWLVLDVFWWRDFRVDADNVASQSEGLSMHLLEADADMPISLSVE